MFTVRRICIWLCSAIALVGLASMPFLDSPGDTALAAAPGLTNVEIQTILNQAVATANLTNSGDGLRSNTDPSRGTSGHAQD
jgi:hypothetical protein